MYMYFGRSKYDYLNILSSKLKDFFIYIKYVLYIIFYIILIIIFNKIYNIYFIYIKKSFSVLKTSKENLRDELFVLLLIHTFYFKYLLRLRF